MHNATSRIRAISGGMPNPYAHDPDCDFWFDHYDSECTCRLPAADPAQEKRAVRAEIAELKRRIERLEVRIASLFG
ncbi:MAG: hypothetical protein JOZ17_04130 [Acetobacteraceae bacterium]|nr:hypothetical protein [Acetobacteraceae bacterium]